MEHMDQPPPSRSHNQHIHPPTQPHPPSMHPLPTLQHNLPHIQLHHPPALQPRPRRHMLHVNRLPAPLQTRIRRRRTRAIHRSAHFTHNRVSGPARTIHYTQRSLHHLRTINPGARRHRKLPHTAPPTGRCGDGHRSDCIRPVQESSFSRQPLSAPPDDGEILAQPCPLALRRVRRTDVLCRAG